MNTVPDIAQMDKAGLYRTQHGTVMGPTSCSLAAPVIGMPPTRNAPAAQALSLCRDHAAQQGFKKAGKHTPQKRRPPNSMRPLRNIRSQGSCRHVAKPHEALAGATSLAQAATHLGSK